MTDLPSFHPVAMWGYKVCWLCVYASVCLSGTHLIRNCWMDLAVILHSNEGRSVCLWHCVCGGDRPRDLARRAENVVFLCRQSTMILWQSFLIRSLGGNAVALICVRHRVLSQTCSVAQYCYSPPSSSSYSFIPFTLLLLTHGHLS